MARCSDSRGCRPGWWSSPRRRRSSSSCCSIGAPLGAALGRTAWAAFVDRLGISGPSGIDWTLLGALVIVVIVLTWLVARSPHGSPLVAHRRQGCATSW